ncbi:hypothetical protein [Bacillus toyonensis]|nr:hypothetical protein [Bacillus toyonensis]
MALKVTNGCRMPTTESAFTVSDFADAEDFTEESLSKVLLKLTKKRV